MFLSEPPPNLARTYQIVPPGQESGCIDIETELNNLFRNA